MPTISAETLQRAHDAWLKVRLARLRERYPNASPYFNLYSPLLDEPAQGIETAAADETAQPAQPEG